MSLTNKTLQLTPKDIDRFEALVDKTSGPGGCWNWKGKPHQGSGGRGRFTAQGITDYAYRFAMYLEGHRFEDGDVINHVCNNPNCVRPHPEHCEFTDRAGDALHRAQQGRGPRKIGRRRAKAVLKRLRAPERPTHREIAEEIGVSRTAISQLARGVTYKWLDSSHEDEA